MSNDNDLVAKLIERVESKVYGKYRGYVTDNKDPESRGRIKAKVPNLLGETETGWCEPCLPFGGSDDTGFYMIPDEGAGVWLEFENGVISLPIWSGVWWSSAKIPKEARNSSKPTKNIIKTKKGHIIELEDEDGEEKITIKDKTQQNMIEIDSVKNSVTIKANIIEIQAKTTMAIKSDGPITIKGSLIKLN